MQPNNQDGQWQQPRQDSSQASYVSPPGEPSEPPSSPGTGYQPDQNPESVPTERGEESTGTANDVSNQASPPSAEAGEVLVKWQASEYLQYQRSKAWYVALFVVSLLLIVIAIIFMQSPTFAILVPIMAAALVIYTRHQPAVIDYILSKKGLYVNDKLYSYANFKSFGIVTYNGRNTVQLIPRKRFQMGLNIYFPDEVGESLVDMLASRLPMQKAHTDLYDKITSKLKM